MKLNLQRKISLGALVLAGTAFAADRCFFTPRAASANPLVENATAPAAPQKHAPAGSAVNSETLIDLAEISAALQQAARSAQIDPSTRLDGFHPSSAWIERAAARTRKPLPSLAEQFRGRHHLMAVMTGELAGWAIIDGKTVAIGQSIDHFQLIQIHDRSAVFESPDARVELQVAK